MAWTKTPAAVTAPTKKAAAPATPVRKLFGKATTSAAGPVKGASKIAPAGKKARTEDDDETFDGDDDSVGTGWGGAKKMAAEHAGFANRLSMKEEIIPVKFGGDEPYATVATHWFKRKGRQSFQCIKSKTVACPLCDMGDKPRVSYLFNVIQLTDGPPVLYSWEVGIRVFRKLEKLAQHPKNGPLSKMFYEIERTGLGQNDTNYDVRVIRRADDIEESFPNTHIPTAAELAKLTRYTKQDALKNRPSISDMQEIAAEVTGGADDYSEADDDSE